MLERGLPGALRRFSLMICLALVSAGALGRASLSNDGTTLNGVQFKGKRYTVTFGDRVVGDTFPAETVNDPGWAELANGISSAVVVALNSIFPEVLPEDIAGCTSPIECVLILPDQLNGSRYTDIGAARVAAIVGDNAFIGGPADKAADSSTTGFPGETLMTFRDDSLPPPSDGMIEMSLEEPNEAAPVNSNAVFSGIGNIRGWAVSPEGIDRVEIYIDGEFFQDAPYGGLRDDVANVYPPDDYPDSDASGFSLAFFYGLLNDGQQHTVTARAFDNDGNMLEQTATFIVAGYDTEGIIKPEQVNTDGIDCVSGGGDEIFVDNVEIDGKTYDLRLKWAQGEQAFVLVGFGSAGCE